MRYAYKIIGIGVLGTLSLCSTRNPKSEDTEQLVAPIAIGCPNTEYGDWSRSEYVLPYPIHKEYTVNLSHCSGSYHSEGQPDAYAIDFAMDIGTIVSASRAGKVVYVEESGNDGDFPNNLVIVEHDDGTFAQYMHLTKDGALVNVGEALEQGDLIGLSGSTGLAGYPHLHFVVTQPGSYKYPYTSLPTTFKNTIANEKSLAMGTRYPAYKY